MKETIKNAFTAVVNFVKSHKTECAIFGASALGLAGVTVIKVKKAKTVPALPETTECTEEPAAETEEDA